MKKPSAITVLRIGAVIGALAWALLLFAGDAKAARAIPDYDLSYNPMVQAHGVMSLVKRGKKFNKRRKWPSNEEIARISLLIQDYSETRNLSPYIVSGLVWTESAFRPWAVNKNDGGSPSVGLGQLKLKYMYKEWPKCSHLVGPGPIRVKREHLLDPEVNICMVTAILAKNKKKYGSKALTVYNCGPYRCKHMKGEPRAVKAYWRNAKKLHTVGETHLKTLPPLIADTDLFTAPAGIKGLHLDPSGCGESSNSRMVPHEPNELR